MLMCAFRVGTSTSCHQHVLTTPRKHLFKPQLLMRDSLQAKEDGHSQESQHGLSWALSLLMAWMAKIVYLRVKINYLGVKRASIVTMFGGVYHRSTRALVPPSPTDP